MKYKLMYIDDDIKYALFLKRLLEKNEFIVDICSNPDVIIKNFKEGEYDIIITDLYLQSVKGTFVVDYIKKRAPMQKMIVLTCSKDVKEEFNCLNNGADEYICKEKGLNIILERIKKLVRREVTVKYEKFLISKLESLVLDLVDRSVFIGEERVDITTKEFELLHLFLSNKNKVLPREQIINQVWFKGVESDNNVDFRTVDAHIKNLRIKLGISSILSVRGVGYRWYEKG